MNPALPPRPPGPSAVSACLLPQVTASPLLSDWGKAKDLKITAPKIHFSWGDSGGFHGNLGFYILSGNALSPSSQREMKWKVFERGLEIDLRSTWSGSYFFSTQNDREGICSKHQKMLPGFKERMPPPSLTVWGARLQG